MSNPSENYIDRVTIRGVTYYLRDNRIYGVDGGEISGLPPVTSANNDSILQVVNGQWSVVQLSTAEGEGF